MTYVAIVIVDAQVARDQEIKRNLDYNIVRRPNISQGQLNMLRKRIENSHGKLRPVGTLHTVVALECPEDMPNCRNCGDPEEDCYGPNHCPSCGTLHGCAPDRIVAQNGYKLISIDNLPTEDQMWDVKTEMFISREV